MKIQQTVLIDLADISTTYLSYELQRRGMVVRTDEEDIIIAEDKCRCTDIETEYDLFEQHELDVLLSKFDDVKPGTTEYNLRQKIFEIRRSCK